MPKTAQIPPVAKGTHYFGSQDVPITAKRVTTQEDGQPSHPHDLTEVEHSHDFNELVIVLKGMARHHLEGDIFPVNTGDVFLLHGHQQHYFDRRRDLELLNVMFDPRRIQLPESDLRKLPGYCAVFLLEPQFRGQHRFASRLHLHPVQLARAERLATEMMREADQKELGYEVALTSRLLDLILYVSRMYTEAETTEAHALLRIGNVISALESNFEHPWCIEDFLKMAHMSRSNFMRVFKRATAQSPMEYVTRLRIRSAMQLLRDSDRSMTEIAGLTGFGDSNYFARQFRKATGISPSNYRESARI